MEVEGVKAKTSQDLPKGVKTETETLAFLKQEQKGRCKVIFESDTGWIFLDTSGNGGLWLASTILNIQWEARTGVSVTLKMYFTTAFFIEGDWKIGLE